MFTVLVVFAAMTVGTIATARLASELSRANAQVDAALAERDSGGPLPGQESPKSGRFVHAA